MSPQTQGRMPPRKNHVAGANPHFTSDTCQGQLSKQPESDFATCKRATLKSSRTPSLARQGSISSASSPKLMKPHADVRGRSRMNITCQVITQIWVWLMEGGSTCKKLGLPRLPGFSPCLHLPSCHFGTSYKFVFEPQPSDGESEPRRNRKSRAFVVFVPLPELLLPLTRHRKNR